jgi:hypothetical protein
VKNFEEEGVTDFLDSLSAQVIAYFIIERRHRAIGAALAIGNVPILELKTDEDQRELLRKVSSGEILDYNGHEEQTLGALAANEPGDYWGFADGWASTVFNYAEDLVWSREEAHEDNSNEVPQRIVDCWRKRNPEPAWVSQK